MARKAKRDVNYNGNKGGEATRAERLAHCLRVDWTCPYCGRDLRECRIAIDHVKPQYAGGQKGAKNQVACCIPCNSSKQHKLLSDFAERRADDDMIRRVKRITNRKLNVQRAKNLLAG
jgi:5-methylcytosine-specific restriction endonuclease McrA